MTKNIKLKLEDMTPKENNLCFFFFLALAFVLCLPAMHMYFEQSFEAAMYPYCSTDTSYEWWWIPAIFALLSYLAACIVGAYSKEAGTIDPDTGKRHFSPTFFWLSFLFVPLLVISFNNIIFFIFLLIGVLFIPGFLKKCGGS